MKHAIKKLALLLTAVAASHSAMAQPIQRLAGVPHEFTNNTPATGGGTISYQWFRDGNPIPGATDPNYILLDYLAYGTNVEFKRGAVSSTCTGNIIYSGIINVAFGLRVGNVFWASVNVGAYQTFAARPDMRTQFYQWSMIKAWAATGDVADWGTTLITDPSWSINPCPTGWRLPTPGEFTALGNSGYTWAEANSRGNAVQGGFFGPNSTTCTLPNNMQGCLFIPVGGVRWSGNGGLYSENTEGIYWCGTEYTNVSGFGYGFRSGSAALIGVEKASGLPIRCVKQ